MMVIHLCQETPLLTLWMMITRMLELLDSVSLMLENGQHFSRTISLTSRMELKETMS